MNDILLTIENTPFTQDCIKDIKQILFSAQKQSYKTVNSIMIQAYWLVGCRIVEEEQNGEKRAGYGEKLIENLSKELNRQFGSGMSIAQLKNCRQFYVTFPSQEISYTLCSQLSWSHLRLIMRRDNQQERDFYIEESKKGNWSVRELERNLKTDMFHRVVKNQSNCLMKNDLPRTVENQIKDPYILEFLGIKPEIKYSEKHLENAIITHLEKFLLEMGRGFSFVERQMHIKAETADFYIDLVFYNYILKCFVLIDLKKNSLSHQDIGQMDMYVRMFDSLKKNADDNPTIGIILCSDKDETIVRYSALNDSEQILASKYKTVLPTEEELTAELDRNRKYLENKMEKNHQNMEDNAKP